jgi:hypothetical protein
VVRKREERNPLFILVNQAGQSKEATAVARGGAVCSNLPFVIADHPLARRLDFRRAKESRQGRPHCKQRAI